MGHTRPWTAEEDARIQDLWSSCTVNQIGDSLKRNRNVVRQRAAELGLPKKRRTPPVSIALRNSPGPSPRRPSGRTNGQRCAGPSCAGVGRGVVFAGVARNGVFVCFEGRNTKLPPLSHLVDAGDWRMDWRSEAGRRQLAVAILGYMRHDARTVQSLLDSFLGKFGQRLGGELWKLPGIDVDDWIRERARR